MWYCQYCIGVKKYGCGECVVLTDSSMYMYCKFLDFDTLLYVLSTQKQSCDIGNAQQEILLENGISIIGILKKVSKIFTQNRIVPFIW